MSTFADYADWLRVSQQAGPAIIPTTLIAANAHTVLGPFNVASWGALALQIRCQGALGNQAQMFVDWSPDEAFTDTVAAKQISQGQGTLYTETLQNLGSWVRVDVDLSACPADTQVTVKGFPLASYHSPRDATEQLNLLFDFPVIAPGVLYKSPLLNWSPGRALLSVDGPGPYIANVVGLVNPGGLAAVYGVAFKDTAGSSGSSGPVLLGRLQPYVSMSNLGGAPGNYAVSLDLEA